MKPEQNLDPAARERIRKRREEEERWKRILAWYMMQKWELEKQAAIERVRSRFDFREIFRAAQKGESLIQRLFRKEPGRRSLFELLLDMDKYQEDDSPFRRLYHAVRNRPEAEEEIGDAVADVVREAPQRILEREKLRQERRSMGEKPDPVKDADEERRLRCEMAFLRGVMEPALFAELCRELTRQGKLTDPQKDFLYVPDPEGKSEAYRDYAARHQVDPTEKAGRLSNSDEVFTAAAYTLAAWEQKDDPDFDAKRADARAMEFSGSKAFRSYMNQHPGALLAAARNTGLDAIHEEIVAMDARLTRRDARLGNLRDCLKANAAGKSAEYHKMMNGLDRFLRSAVEPEQAEREETVKLLAAYALTEGNPKHPRYDPAAAVQAVSAVRELCSERDFALLLEKMNEQRSPDTQIRPEDLDAAAERKAPEPERQAAGPEPVLR